MKDYFVLAFKNLKRRGIRSWLTLIGILIGVAAVISLISLGNGLKMAVNSQFNIGSTEVITVQAGGVTGYGLPGTGVITPLTTDDVEAIGKIATVQIATGRNVRSIKAEYNKKTVFTLGITVPDNAREASLLYEILGIKIESGKLINQGDRGVVILGNNFVDGATNKFDRNLKVGDIIKINEKNFKVQGILEKKNSFIIDSAIRMNEKDLKELFNYGNKIDIIEVKVSSKEFMNQTKTAIENLLRQRRNVKVGQEDFSVTTPQATLSSVNQIIFGIQIFVIIIASISIFVGAIGISNTMMTSVMERRKDIGIMKAIGARNEHIFYQFFIEAGLLGLAGGIAGILTGTLIGYIGTTAINNFLGSSAQPQISLYLIFLALIGSFIVGSVSGLIPAMKAAKQNPVEDIKG